MKLLVVIILVASVVLFMPAVIKAKCPKLATWLEDKTYLNLVTVLGLVLSAVSLAFAFFQFQAAQKDQQELAKRQALSRLTTLEAELEVNLHVCQNELLKSEQTYTKIEAFPVPESRFYTKIIEETLGRGDITKPELRSTLWNAYRLMSTVNSLLSQAISIRHTEHIADPRDHMLISGRREKVNNLVSGAMDFSRKAEPLVAQSLEHLKELKKA